MWSSLDDSIKNGALASTNTSLGVFPGGLPPCGVPLFDNFDVDMQHLSGARSGIMDQNKKLNKEWGTMVRSCFVLCLHFSHILNVHPLKWGDWIRHPTSRLKKKQKRFTIHLGAIESQTNDIAGELPLHKSNVFFSWWKHTPPQHPMINCFRSDTLYVIMVRHPLAWVKSTDKQPYGESTEFTF
jgi:hypothetical protein